MVSIITNSFPFKRKLIFFANEPSLKMGLFDNYMQSFCLNKIFGFKRTPKYTKLIDLSDNRFMEEFSKNTRYDIRRAESEGITCKTITDISACVHFINEFLRNKNLGVTISEKSLSVYGDALIIRAAYTSEGKELVYHTLLCDTSLKRVRGLHSASIIHNKSLTPYEKAVAGRANRYLDYDNFLYFKDKGYHFFDLGGYAHNSENESLQGINRFKDGFGGILVEESNYESLPVYYAKILKQFIVKLSRNIQSTGKHGKS